MQRRIPYGVANYAKIVEENYYFVDKTSYLRELARFETPVFLRSRRFGKSLWCSILEHYYDVRFAGDFEKLFGKTDIGRDPTPDHNQYLVLRFDFSKVKVETTYGALEKNFNEVITMAVRPFVSAHASVSDFSDVLKKEDATSALNSIIEVVRERNLPRLRIVIDEYDNFTNTLITSQRDDLYTEVTTGDSFLRTFFKVIKAGVGEGSVANVFITGVLPVTMDDLTSGYNIARLVTFEPPLLHMLGFTQEEVNRYVDEIFADHPEWDPAQKSFVLAELKANYNGYHLLPGEKTCLYNSTVTNYYLDYFTRNGVPPPEKFDPNLNTDINWIKRLARSNENAKELVDQLLLGSGIPTSETALAMTFNKEKLFDPTYFKVTLYYLGLVTFISDTRVGIPNLTVRRLYTDYFNSLWEMTSIVNSADDLYDAFRTADCDWAILFDGFYEKYLKILPAQAYDKVNENFIRSTFFLTFRERLDKVYAMSIEVNHPSGRSDFEAIGKADGVDPATAVVVEFKHYTQAAMKTAFGKVLESEEDFAALEAPQDAVEQVNRYAADLAAENPTHKVRKYIVATFSTKGYRLWRGG